MLDDENNPIERPKKEEEKEETTSLQVTVEDPNSSEKPAEPEQKKPETHINHLNVEAKKNFINRIVMSILIIAVTVPCVVLGDYVFLVFIFVISCIATHEIIKCPQSVEKKFKNIIYVFAYIFSFIIIYWVFAKNNLASYFSDPDNYSFSLYVGFDSPFLSLAAFAICILFFFLMVFIDKTFTLEDAFYFIVMLFIVSMGFQCLLYLRFFPYAELLEKYNTLIQKSVVDQEEINAILAQLDSSGFKYGQSTGLIFYLLIGVFANDAGAYLFGVLFGKHKMCPRISPKKTWEGFAGGVITSIVLSMLFAFLMAYFGYPILNVLDIDHWYNILILSILMPIVGTIGDLLFSTIKRHYHIKDFGQVLKSHGGILDRLDSVLITAMVVGAIIPIMENAWLIYL